MAGLLAYSTSKHLPDFTKKHNDVKTVVILSWRLYSIGSLQLRGQSQILTAFPLSCALCTKPFAAAKVTFIFHITSLFMFFSFLLRIDFYIGKDSRKIEFIL